jgi:hypothetical protein
MSTIERNIRSILALASLAAALVVPITLGASSASAATTHASAVVSSSVTPTDVPCPRGQLLAFHADCIRMCPLSGDVWVPCKIQSSDNGYSFWHVVKCAAVLAVVVGGHVKMFQLITKLGGFIDAARLLVIAGNYQDGLIALGGIGAEVLGLKSVQDACF